MRACRFSELQTETAEPNSLLPVDGLESLTIGQPMSENPTFSECLASEYLNVIGKIACES